jgi:glycine cleavage system aminomethyltransferase T
MALLQQTPFHARCLALGGRMTAFAGWQMPVQFTGISLEHEAVRTRAGLFDISHMGKLELEGRGRSRLSSAWCLLTWPACNLVRPSTRFCSIPRGHH